MDFIPGKTRVQLTLLHHAYNSNTRPTDWAHRMVLSYLLPSNPVASMATTMRGRLQPLLSKLTTAPDLATLALLLIILFLSLKILDMLRRAVMFWVALAIRAVTWGTVIFGILWVFNRGVDGVVQDVEYYTRFFFAEWRRWEDQAAAAAARQFDGQTRGGGTYMGRR